MLRRNLRFFFFHYQKFWNRAFNKNCKTFAEKERNYNMWKNAATHPDIKSYVSLATSSLSSNL